MCRGAHGENGGIGVGHQGCGGGTRRKCGGDGAGRQDEDEVLRYHELISLWIQSQRSHVQKTNTQHSLGIYAGVNPVLQYRTELIIM
jgi:hypothetical protein